jgi:hypothetical protein
MDRDRSNWQHWMTRLSVEESDELLEWGKYLVQKGYIQTADRYNIARWALKAALRTFERNATKKQSAASET